ncbi:MAG TPA: nuclear transport factor 2 family protein [Solirubrobacteraceae bacterium]|nr:nuclear transport factor 2 family protein [Solirubrobacteraceae bacterium]
MSITAAVTIDDLRAAALAGGGRFGEHVTDDVEFTEIDQRTPPAAPGIRRGRSELIALAEDLERRGIRVEVADGFLTGDRGAVRMVCTYPDGRKVVEHALLTLRDGKIARWDGVQAWDE